MNAAANARPVVVVPRSTAGLPPPHDLEAQESLLGTLIKYPECMDLVVDGLMAEHFFGEGDQHTFEALLELHNAGTPIDVSAVVSWLEDRKLTIRVGGKERLATLLCVDEVRSVEANARRITLKWRLRRLIAECQLIEAEAYGEIQNIREFLEVSAERLAPFALEPEGKTAELVGDTIRDLFGDINAAAEAGSPVVGISTGLRDLSDKIGGLREGLVTIVAGRPGMGKSALAMQWALSGADTPSVISDSNGNQFQTTSTSLVFSLEMPRKELVGRLVCSLARVDNRKITNNQIQPDDWPYLTSAASELSRKSIIIDDEGGLSPIQIRARARRIKAHLEKTGGPPLRLIIVDYLQLMNARPLLPKNSSRELEISECSRFLKRLAKELKVAVVALAQLSRECEKRSDKRPQLSDLRESGSIEQDADLVVFIYRDEYYLKDKTPKDLRGVAELLIAKQRGGQMGGVVRTKFWDYCTRFDNLDS